MNPLKYIPRTAIKISFNLSVWTIEELSDMAPYHKREEELRRLPAGTLGNDIAQCLDDNNIHLVPGYESHDLKHVLLDFKMTPIDEIRMQAFMLGNGNYTFPCFAILTFGALLLPLQWATLYRDFRRGQTAKQISTWTIDTYAEIETEHLRKLVFESTETKQITTTMKSLTKSAAFASVIAGIAGMLYCLPSLFSDSVPDLIGAGFPFVGGAILTVGGLLSLSNLSTPARTSN